MDVQGRVLTGINPMHVTVVRTHSLTDSVNHSVLRGLTRDQELSYNFTQIEQ